MKHLITVIFCLFSITTTFAQNIDFTKVKEKKESKKAKNENEEKEIKYNTKHKIGLNIGNSTAIGLFGSYDEDDGDVDYNPGYAKNGFSYNLSYQYSFTDNLAATFVFGGDRMIIILKNIWPLSKILMSVDWIGEVKQTHMLRLT